jgi:hypothetical protein
MSGAFELAAGSFAVVGVVDVILRSGREIYNFLNNVADAPEDIDRLRETVTDMLRLCQASKDLIRSSTSAGRSAATLIDSATKSLDREVQTLRRIILKFKGSKTWSRVKYVLDEAKVKKAMQSLAQANALLANALNLASRYVLTGSQYFFRKPQD